MASVNHCCSKLFSDSNLPHTIPRHCEPPSKTQSTSAALSREPMRSRRAGGQAVHVDEQQMRTSPDALHEE